MPRTWEGFQLFARAVKQLSVRIATIVCTHQTEDRVRLFRRFPSRRRRGISPIVATVSEHDQPPRRNYSVPSLLKFRPIPTTREMPTLIPRQNSVKKEDGFTDVIEFRLNANFHQIPRDGVFKPFAKLVIRPHWCYMLLQQRRELRINRCDGWVPSRKARVISPIHAKRQLIVDLQLNGLPLRCLAARHRLLPRADPKDVSRHLLSDTLEPRKTIEFLYSASGFGSHRSMLIYTIGNPWRQSARTVKVTSRLASLF